ncbi:MAG: hypothetical protein H8F28_07885 [Fibrella sp.]|nr:hypothetical protein [Armatimonadota bacterium]
MQYDTQTYELRTDEGKLLKKLNCPIHKEWSQLHVIPGDETKRRCGVCEKSVVNLVGKSDEEAEALFEKSPDCCVCIVRGSRNVRVYRHKDASKPDPCPFRRIRTARGEDAINQAAKDGLWPLVMKVEQSRKIYTWMAVYQNEQTGAVLTVGDSRYLPESPWKRIIKPFSFYPDHFEHKIAAYLIPNDLAVGERVFLVDLIEDLVAVYGNQEHTSRLDSAYAIWTGKKFRVEWSEWRDADRFIG